MTKLTRIGFVHFGGGMGDLVRVKAVRRFFDDNSIPYKDFSLSHVRAPVNILRELIRPGSLRHLARKCFIDGKHPLLKEINWRVEVRQWESDVKRAANQIAEQIEGLDLLHAETAFAGLVCRRVKQLRGLPYVYDAHGFLSEESKLVGSLEYVRACERWDREVIQDAQTIVVVSEAARDHLETRYGFPRTRTLLCPNGTYSRPSQANYQEPLNIVFAGNFAPYENVMTFVKTAALVASEKVRFVLIGDGAQRNEIFDYVNSQGIDITYLGKKRFERVFDFLGQMQVGFVGYDGEPTPLAHPMKIGDYASCGLPILAAPGAWTDPIKRYGCGVVTTGIQPEQFAAAIETFLNRGRWESMSGNAKKMANEVFPWQLRLRPLGELYGARVGTA
jgi:glycosyltransferase involved in cell wall biosynthesis